MLRSVLLICLLFLWLLTPCAHVCAEGVEGIAETDNFGSIEAADRSLNSMLLPGLGDSGQVFHPSGNWDVSVEGLLWQMRSGVKGRTYIEDPFGNTVLASDDAHSDFQPGIQISLVRSSFLQEDMNLVIEGTYIDWQDQYHLRDGDRVPLLDGFLFAPKNLNVGNTLLSVYVGMQKDLGPVDPILGIRWLGFSDDFYDKDILSARNRILGGEIGAKVDWYASERVRLSSSTRVGAGFNDVATRNLGYGLHKSFNDILGYWQANDSLDTYSNWLDASVSLDFRITRRAVLSFHYGMYWIDNLALAGSQPKYAHPSTYSFSDQIYYIVPGGVGGLLTPADISSLTDPSVNTDGSPLMHGGSIALTFTY